MKYRILKKSNKCKTIYIPQYKYFLFWHDYLDCDGYSTFKHVYSNIEGAKNKIEEHKHEIKCKLKYKKEVIKTKIEIVNVG